MCCYQNFHKGFLKAASCLMLRAVIKTFLPKPMELSSMKQQSIRSPRQWGKVRVLPDPTAVKDHGVTTVTTSVSEDCQGVFLIFFFKSSSWKQFLSINSPFSWVAKLQLVEHMTCNICSTSAEDASICQLHHIQSPSYFVQVVLVVYVTSRQVRTTSCYSE